MTKHNIILYDEFKFPMSLRDIPLKPDCDGRIEYIFFSLNIAKDFDDLTMLLERVLDCPFSEIKRDEKNIFYKIIINDESCTLQFRIKKQKRCDAA